MNHYERWITSPEGKAQAKHYMDKAKADVDAHIARRKSEAEQAMNKWVMKSADRAADNKLHQQLGKHAGRIDDTYTAEVPLTLGYNTYEDGVTLAYVSLGGVDVSEYLPPDVLADIRSHIACCFEDEIGRTA